MVLCPHVSGLHWDRKFLLSIMTRFFLTLALGLRLLYYFLFVTAWPVELEVDSTHVFKGRS